MCLKVGKISKDIYKFVPSPKKLTMLFSVNFFCLHTASSKAVILFLLKLRAEGGLKYECKINILHLLPWDRTY